MHIDQSNQYYNSGQPSEQSDWFIYCAISPEILYGHYVCDAINYTIKTWKKTESCSNSFSGVQIQDTK